MATAGSKLAEKGTFEAKAILVGERIALRPAEPPLRPATTPLWVDLENGGAAVLFRYGAVVLLDVGKENETQFLVDLQSRITKPLLEFERETEGARIRVEPGATESLQGEALVLNSASQNKLLIVADVLAQSVALARHEAQVSQQFDKIEPFARNVDHTSRGARAARELLNHLGGALMAEHDMAAQMEVEDTPDLLWDHPEFDGLWKRLSDEYELRVRYATLNRKLSLLGRTAETALNVLHNNRALRVEYYIVALIVFEILFSIVTQFWLKGH
jgi:uncharacterized Rmd1/YagE family protein